jgi:hypothetical protein
MTKWWHFPDLVHLWFALSSALLIPFYRQSAEARETETFPSFSVDWILSVLQRPLLLKAVTSYGTWSSGGTFGGGA